MTTAIPVAICVATLQRPEGLRNLLASLAVLETPGLDVRLIVVDNDGEGSAADTVESFRQRIPFPVTYLVQPMRGIPPARNTFVDEVRRQKVDFFAMIDDDETADPKWLRTLVTHAIDHSVDVLGGAAIPVFPPGTPESIRICFKFYEPPPGEEVRRLSTANILFRVSAIDYLQQPFNMALGNTGSDDSELTERLFVDGRKLAFTHDAITYEHIPASRTEPRWILKRAYRVGVTNTQVARAVYPSRGKSAKLFATSIGRIMVGSVQVLQATIFDRPMVLFRARRVASGVGSIATLLSSRAIYNEYNTVHGK